MSVDEIVLLHNREVFHVALESVTYLAYIIFRLVHFFIIIIRVSCKHLVP